MLRDISSGEIVAIFVIAGIFLTLLGVLHIYNQDSVLGNKDDYISRFLTKKQHDLNIIGGSLSIDTYLLILLISPFALGVGSYIVMKSGLASIILAILGIFLPDLILKIIKDQSNKKFEERYARSLEQLGASLRAGMSIMQAVEDTANCDFLHPSILKRYQKLSSDLKMGIDVETAFRRFADSTESTDAHDVALAIDVQNEIGGHEADVIQNIATNIQNRINLRLKINSIFASSATMITFMDYVPYLVIAGCLLFQRSMAETYFSKPAYMVIFFACLGMPIIGSFINHRAIDRLRKGA